MNNWKSKTNDNSDIWKYKQILLTQTYLDKNADFLMNTLGFCAGTNRSAPATMFGKNEFYNGGFMEHGEVLAFFENPEVLKHKQILLNQTIFLKHIDPLMNMF